MGAEVKILIQAVDQASKTMGGLFGSFTELNSALGLVEKGLGYVDKALDATVGAFTKYAEQVEDLSRNTGMTAEETSRLIQTSDDLFIEFGSLTQAAKALKEKGMQPTIETLAMLSNQYLAMEDPVKRAQFANDNFGRSYQEMTKILEAGGNTIKEMAATTPEGLILSEEDLKSAKEYKKSLDDLNDSLQALAIQVGEEVVPALIDMVNELTKIVEFVPKLKAAMKEPTTVFDETAVAARKAGVAYDVFVASMYEPIAAGYYDAPTEAQYRSIAVLDELSNVLRDTGEEVTKFTEGHIASYEELTEAVYGLDGADQIYHDGLLDQIEAQQLSTDKIIATKVAAYEAANSIGTELTKAYANLTAAQQAWNTTVGEDAAASLKAMSKDAGLTAQGLGAIDSVFGTNTLARQQYEETLAAITEEFTKTGDVEAYKTKLGELAETFESVLAKDIKVAQDRVDNLQHALNLLATTPAIHIPIYIETHGDIPVPGGGGGGGGGGENIPPPGSTFTGGGRGRTIINVYPASVSAANAAIAAALAQTRNQGINSRMSVG